MTAAARQDQPLEALALANEIRLARAGLRREVAKLPADEGRARLARLLDDPAWRAGGPAATATVVSVLTWPAYAGPVGARRLSRRLGIGDNRQVRDLTVRQARQVAAWLRAERRDRW